MPPEIPPKKESDSNDFDKRHQGNTKDTNQTDSNSKPNDTRSNKPGITTSRFRKKRNSSATQFGERAKTIGSLGMIPILLGVGPIIGALVGDWLDKKFDTNPWLTILFVIFGFIAAVREMMRLLKQNELDEARKKRKQEERDNENS